MYGKFFASTYTGSMMGAGSEVFAVWGYVIANAVDSSVELNPKLLAAVLGTTSEAAESAIAYLCSPDPMSRNPADEGRRLVKEGTYQYRVVSHSLYRSVRNEEERREYNRIKKRESRKRKLGQTDVIDMSTMSTMSAHTEAEVEAEAKTKTTDSKESFFGDLETAKTKKRSNGHSGEDIERVYRAYPLKKKPGDARKAIGKAIARLRARGESDPVGFLIDRIAKWKAARERDEAAGRFVPNCPYPATWLNGECYDEETLQPVKQSSGPSAAERDAIEFQRQKLAVVPKAVSHG